MVPDDVGCYFVSSIVMSCPIVEIFDFDLVHPSNLGKGEDHCKTRCRRLLPNCCRFSIHCCYDMTYCWRAIVAAELDIAAVPGPISFLDFVLTMVLLIVVKLGFDFDFDLTGTYIFAT